MMRLFITTLLFVCFAFCNQGLCVQKPASSDGGPYGIFPSRAEYNQFMGSAKRAAYGPEGTAELKAMIPLLNDIALDKPVGTTAKDYNVGGSTVGLLSSSDVRKELEMVDDQYQQLRSMNQELQKRAADQIRSLDFSNPQNLVIQVRKIRSDAQKDLEGLLLPHQTKRLNQIRMQSQLGRNSLVSLLTRNPIKEELKITEVQAKKLVKAEAEIEADLQQEIAKLRAKARDRLLSQLNPDQKKNVQEMIGDAFEFKTSDRSKSKSGNKKNKAGKGKSRLKNK